MESPNQAPEALQFGRFRVLTRRRELLLDGAPVELGSRAFDVLLVLIEAGGTLVTKDELLQRVWPTAIVEENTLQSQIYALRKALGSERGLVMTVPGRGYRFTGDVAVLDDKPPSDQPGDVQSNREPETPPRQLGNLPTALSPLIGRSKELQDVRDLLDDCRLVTLTGPGGIGKTRLAIEAARGLVSAFRNGVWLVELGSLANPDLVGTAILAALGLQTSAIQVSQRQLSAAFGDKQMLFALDNCEHLVEAVARTAEHLLRAAPAVRILATSREPLGAEGEYAYQVQPLATPDSPLRSLDEILSHAAVSLFVARMDAAASGFVLDERNASLVTTICRRLDGIPLAIELAAARAAGLGVQTVAARLDQLFDLLSRGRRTALARQQTLRATLDWSYGLLPEEQRRVFRRLSVFVGGFTLQAAIAVAVEASQPEHEIIDHVTDLVSKSLVIAETGRGEPRFRLLETTRAYGLRRLEESGASDRIRRRHAVYFRGLLMSAQSDELESGIWTAPAREIDNVRAALAWGFGAGADPALGFSLAVSAIPLWLEASLPGECQRWLEQAIALIDAAAARGTRAEMLAQSGLGMSQLLTTPAGRDAEQSLLRALELAEALDDKQGQLRVLVGLVFIYLRRAEIAVAMDYARRLDTAARGAASPAWVVSAQRCRGMLLHFAGDQAGALAGLESALEGGHAISRRSYTHLGIDHQASAHCFLANALWLKGFPDRAVQAMRQGIEEARNTGHVVSICHALTVGGTTALRVGDFAAAERYANELVDHAEEIGSEVYLAYGLAARAVARARWDDVRTAVGPVRAVLEAIRQHRIGMLSLIFGADFAETLMAAGHREEALAVIEETLLIADRGGGRVAMADLLRVKGEVQWADEGPNRAGALEASLAQALDWARRQQTLAWELRVVTSLARLRRWQGRPAEAYDVLRPVYARFTEGFGTRDLEQAQALLRELN